MTKTNFDNKAIYFLHFPKTAGTSLVSILESFFKEDEICPPYFLPKLVEISRQRFNRYRLVRGHFTHNLLDRFDTPPLTITLLRDPVKRTISHLKHMRESDRFWMRKHIPLATMSLDEMLQEELVIKLMQDHQLRRFAIDIDYDHLQHPICLDKEIIGRNHLNLAKERLEAFDFVGITEEFESSLKLLSAVLSKKIENVPVLNTAKERTDIRSKEAISQDSIKIIERITALDREFYEFARMLFHQRLREANLL